MRRLMALLLILVSIAGMAGCKNNTPKDEIQIGKEYDFDGVTRIELTNAHNGRTTIITDEKDMSSIITFVGETAGKCLGSGKGYYEGTYSVEFYSENNKIFSLGYGDSDVFYMGRGDDGYPVRYGLVNRTIKKDVVPFFSQYDQSQTEKKES